MHNKTTNENILEDHFKQKSELKTDKSGKKRQETTAFSQDLSFNKPILALFRIAF